SCASRRCGVLYSARNAIDDFARDLGFGTDVDSIFAVGGDHRYRIVVAVEAEALTAPLVPDDHVETRSRELGARVRDRVVRFGGEADHEGARVAARDGRDD